MPKIEILDGDDWIQVFVDAKLVYEGFRMRAVHVSELLQKLGFSTEVKFGRFGGFDGTAYDETGRPIFIQE